MTNNNINNYKYEVEYKNKKNRRKENINNKRLIVMIIFIHFFKIFIHIFS